MKKSNIISVLMAMSILNLNAAEEEFMVVSLKDGSKVEYNVKDVSRIAFDIRDVAVAFSIKSSDGETVSYPSIPVLFRESPTETGGYTGFGFGTVHSDTPEGLASGEYGLYLTLSASKLYTSDLDLANERNSYSLQLVKYTEGGSEYILDNVSEGTLTTAIDRKSGNVTLKIDALFDDGTEVSADYKGAVKSVETLSGMIPGIVYGNEFFYYDLNGNQSIHANVESVDHTYSSYSKKHTFYFYTDSQKVYDDIKLVIEEDLINAGTLNLSETKGWSFQYGVIQLYGNDPSDPSAQYKNCADNGTMKVALNDDGTYELFIEVQNYYNNYMGTHLGTTEKIILNYVGAVE